MIINAQDIINALTRLERVVHERDPRKTAADANRLLIRMTASDGLEMTFILGVSIGGLAIAYTVANFIEAARVVNARMHVQELLNRTTIKDIKLVAEYSFFTFSTPIQDSPSLTRSHALMKLYVNINEASDQSVIGENGMSPDRAMECITEFRKHSPHRPIEITDENGLVLINEERNNP